MALVNIALNSGLPKGSSVVACENCGRILGRPGPGEDYCGLGLNILNLPGRGTQFTDDESQMIPYERDEWSNGL